MKVFQVVYNNVPDKVQLCMESVKIYYPQVEVFKFDLVENPVHDSDILRMKMLEETDDTLFIDWDILIKKELTLVKNDMPCCAFYKDQPDHCLIYSPSKNFFEELEKERVLRGISKDVYGWPRKLLRGKKVNRIDDNEFIHLRGEEKWKTKNE